MVKRWLAIPAGGDALRLIPVDPPSCGPDVFVKLADYDALAARLADCELERDVAREMARDKAARLAEAEFDANALRELQTPRPLEAWHEDDGPALWWVFPLVEPPYCGSPLDEDWPGYHTHWTTFTIPDAPAVSASAQPDHCEDHREFDIDCLDCQDALIAAKRAASTVSEVEHGGR